MNSYLPEIFAALMGVAILAYVILDGFDLGVGILLRRAEAAEKDLMIASIGPFWDANETWLVLGVGILLTVFPKAHGIILGALYIPVALMLIGLTLRGVAFDFRTKVKAERKQLWDTLFYLGSLLAAWSQGFMLGMHVVAYQYRFSNILFASFIGIALAAGYVLLGATWLLMKTEGALQQKARRWAGSALLLTALGIAAVSVATPMVSAGIFARWFVLPELLWLLPIPLLSALCVGYCAKQLHTPTSTKSAAWQPFAATVAIFFLAFIGLAYSLYPYLVVDQLTIQAGAASVATMRMIGIGALFSIPAIIGYTIFSYRVFWGKAKPLSYL
jgi:cytochrome bd ubiquinol oxidase subunit II